MEHTKGLELHNIEREHMIALPFAKLSAKILLTVYVF